MIKALSNIQAEKAEAKGELDGDMIFEVITKSEGGFFSVNKQVKDSLRTWYIQQLQTASGYYRSRTSKS